MISDDAIQVFKSASIQPRSLTLTHEDVGRLETLAKQVKEILDRGVARDETLEWVKPHKNVTATTLHRYRDKRAGFSQGVPADAVFYIQEDRVKLSVVSKRGREGVIAVLQHGYFFGK